MKNIYIILFSLLQITLYAQQTTYSGRVIDENAKGISYVNVVLINRADSVFIKGVVTDENGQFQIDTEAASAQLLKCSSVGYTETFSEVKNGDIVMAAAAYELGEVAVSGARPIYRMQGTSFVTDVSNSLLKNIGTANDVLKQLPGVISKNDAYEVFGKGAATIYINDKRVRDNLELERLSSDDIVSVELINTPGASYDADVRAVLKIKTRRKIEGFATTVRVQGKQNHKFSDLEQLNLSYTTDKWNWYAQLFHNGRKGQVDGRNNYTIQGENESYHLKMDMMDWEQRAQYITAETGVGFQINPQHEVGVSYIYDYSDNIYRGNDFEVLISGNTTIDELSDYSNSDNDYNQHAVNLYYIGKLGDKLGINLNADYVNRSATDWLQVDEVALSDARTVTSINESLYNLYAAKLVLDYPLGPGKLEAGMDFSYMDYDQDYTSVENYLPDAIFRSEERKLAGFVSYSGNFGKLDWSTGFRYEQFRARYYENEATEPTVERTYKELYPTVSLSLPVGPVNLSLIYSKSTARPSFYQLRNAIEYTSRFIYSQGNPYLQSSQLHDLAFNIGYRFLQLSLGYYYTKDRILSSSQLLDGEELTILSSPINTPRYQGTSAMLTFQHKIGCWHPTWSAGVYKNFFHIYDYTGNKLKLDNPYGYFSINNMFNLPAGIVLNVSGYCMTVGNSGEIKMKSTGSVDISLRKSFLDGKLDLNLQASDLFATMGNNYISYSEYITYDRWNYNDTRSIRLTITYKFNNYTRKYKGYNSASDEVWRM